MSIEENNKLIAEFMGGYEPEEFDDFHNSWDWLMPVVEKIEEMDVIAYFEISQPTIYIWKSSESSTFEDIKVDIHIKSKIEAVYEAVVKFIKWHNEMEKL